MTPIFASFIAIAPILSDMIANTPIFCAIIASVVAIGNGGEGPLRVCRAAHGAVVQATVCAVPLKGINALFVKNMSTGEQHAGAGREGRDANGAILTRLLLCLSLYQTPVSRPKRTIA
eukprot:Colp12_sorted_trinity150504_noHs@787